MLVSPSMLDAITADSLDSGARGDFIIKDRALARRLEAAIAVAAVGGPYQLPQPKAHARR
jgi:hypothetical protein